MLSPLAQLTVISGAVERDDMHYFQVLTDSSSSTSKLWKGLVSHPKTLRHESIKYTRPTTHVVQQCSTSSYYYINSLCSCL